MRNQTHAGVDYQTRSKLLDEHSVNQDTRYSSNTDTQDFQVPQEPQDLQATVSRPSNGLKDTFDLVAMKYLPLGAKEEQLADSLFDMCREIKALWPDLNENNKSKYASMRDFGRCFIQPWIAAASKHLGAKLISEDIFVIFYDKWGASKIPKGGKPVDLAAQQIEDLQLPSDLSNCKFHETLNHLAMLCRQLAINGKTGTDFFLSCRDGARIVGENYRIVSYMFKTLVTFEVIEVLEKGVHGKSGKATAYRYLFDLKA